MPDVDVDVGLSEGSGEPILVGSLRPSFNGGRSLAGSSFQYSSDYLNRPDAYAVSPDLPLAAGRMYTGENSVLFGAFADTAPEEWGQNIIDANHARESAKDAAAPSRLGALDYLLAVPDATRMGALRFRSAGTLSIPNGPAAAPLDHLGRILAVTKRYEDGVATDEDIEYLARVATSLGGTRPKANLITQSGHLAVAKLPRHRDGLRDVAAWEAVALTIAKNAGLRTSPQGLYRIGEHHSILVVRHFDRDGDGNPVGYVSAATALGLGVYDSGRRVTYQEFAATIAQLTENPAVELREMYGRIALTVLVNNVDDHWRNHGFRRIAGGWQLAPLFDVNPSPRHGVVESRAISAADDLRRRDIRNLAAIADDYGLAPDEGKRIIRAVAVEVAKWPELAARHGLSNADIERMAPAFDEEHIRRALDLR